MRQVKGRHECAYCGAPLELEADEVAMVVFRGASGEPNMRAIGVNGREIHRCAVLEDEPSYPTH